MEFTKKKGVTRFDMKEDIIRRWPLLYRAGALSMGGYVAFLLAFKGTALYNFSLAILIVCILILCYRNKDALCLPNKFFMMPYSVFAGGLFLSSLVQGELDNIKEVLHYLYLTLPLFIMYIGGRCFGREDIIYRAFAFGGFVTSVVCVVAYFHPEAWMEGRFSPESHPNVTVQLLALPIPFLVMACYRLKQSRLWCALNILSLTIILAAVWLTRSRGGIAGLLAGGLTLLVLYYPVLKYRWSYKKTVAVSSLLAVVVSALIVFISANVFDRAHSNQGRLYLMYAAVNMFKDHPVCGIGYDNWNREYLNYIHPQSQELHLTHAHNDLLNMLATTGVLGAGGYVIFSVFMWLYLMKRIVRQPKELMLWAMLWMYMSVYIHGMVDISIQYNQSAKMLFGMLGLVLALADKRLEETPTLESNFQDLHDDAG